MDIWRGLLLEMYIFSKWLISYRIPLAWFALLCNLIGGKMFCLCRRALVCHYSHSSLHALSSFQELSRSVYTVDVRADDGVISISIPENITEDVAGNRNLPSNTLHVRHCKDSFFVTFSLLFLFGRTSGCSFYFFLFIFFIC